MKNSTEEGHDPAPRVSFAILLAGGSGSRMRGAVRDKCLEPLSGLPVIAHSARAFLESGAVGGFVVVHRDDAQRAAIEEAFALVPGMRGAGAPGVLWAQGGAERQDSVLSGLEACPPETDLAFIHDTARPLIHPETIRALARSAGEHGAAVAAHRVSDTIKRIRAGDVPGLPASLEDLDRSTLWGMETPQVFRHALILKALREVARLGLHVTDDVAAATRAGHGVALVESAHPNPKLTTPGDIPLLAHLLSAREASAAPRGRLVKLCGVTRAGDARMALALGVAFVGVNAWEHSPRCVRWEDMPALLEAIPQGKRVYVDVDPDDASLARALGLGFDFAQIHFDPGAPGIRERAARWSALAMPSRLWLAPRLAPGAPWPEWVSPLAQTFLFDAYKAGSFGGTGCLADSARFDEIRRACPGRRWGLAGGLGPETLPALRHVAPDFFDLNSGVEEAPGMKSAEKLRAAMAALA
ncbi:MAG: 2-C-methyl-D-erythritol 4-phosphate cytidylyltransferase [Puniceicoccales bacterium]|jgi:2-C-methyl-D-erythritol 4-phosphate cytidylyltransferase|nr:2-C-methyl-D-erythritol 4-phosphate cytidylyltransferase [Puniceicoccales bacterium]